MPHNMVMSAVETPVDGMNLFIPYQRKREEGEVGNFDTDIGDKYAYRPRVHGWHNHSCGRHIIHWQCGVCD
jgi:hypothetical protein